MFSYGGTTVSGLPANRGMNTRNGGAARIGSIQASAQPFQFDQFREFGDNVFQEYQRSTAPEIEARRARMNQDLINRGITPGSEGYEREMDRFMRMENDLFNTAQRSALEQGLAAQNQAFGQSLANAQIQQALAQSNIAAQASRANAAAAAGASRYSADQSRAGALERLIEQLGFDRERLGENQRQFDLGFGEGQRQFDADMGLRQNAFDLGAIQSLLGLAFQEAGFNNDALTSDYQRAAGTVGGFAPTAPIIPIDVGGAFGQNLSGQRANSLISQERRNALGQGIGGLISFGGGLPFFGGGGSGGGSQFGGLF